MKKALGTGTLAVLGLILMTGLAQAQDKKECTDHERMHDWHHKCAPASPLPPPPVEPLHELTPVDYARLAAETDDLRSQMKDPESFTVKATFYKHNGPRTDAAAAARQCGTTSITEKGLEKCLARYDEEVAKYNATKLGTTDFCFLYRATNSYGAHLEDTTCYFGLKGWTEVPPAPALPAATPAEQAKQAQAYADCLKLAVDNPKVVCKP